MSADESIKSDMISLRLKPETHQKLKKEAEAQDVSKSELISNLIRDMVSPVDNGTANTDRLGAGKKVSTGVGSKVGR